MPSPLRFLLLHAAIGFGLAALLVLALLVADPGGVGTLLRRAPSSPAPALLLWLFCGMTFGAVQFGAAVMLLEHREPAPMRRRAAAPRRLG